MDRIRDSRKTTVAAVSGVQRRLQRMSSPNDAPERKLDEQVRLRDREKSKHKKDRDRQYLKRRRADSGEGDGAEEDGRTGVYPTSQRGIRTLRSSPAVLGAPVDEVIGAFVPRRTRSSLARRVHEELSSGSGEDWAHRRLSPAMASVSSVGGDCPASSAKKKKSSVEKRARVLRRTQEDIEMEVAEALFDLMQQNQPQKIGREKSVAADNDELKRSGKDAIEACSLQNAQSVKLRSETKVAGSREERSEEGRVDGVKIPEPTSMKRKHVATVVPNEERRSDEVVVVDDGAQIAQSRPDKRVVNAATNPKVTVVDVAAEPEAALPNANKRSAIPHKEAPAAIQLQKEKEGAVDSNQPISSGMGKSRPDLSRNFMEQWNRSASSMLPQSSGVHGWSGVRPYQGYAPPPLQSVCASRSSPGIQPPLPFKFSQPRDRRCATHQFIARSIRDHHLQQMVESLNRGPGDGGGDSAVSSYAAQLLDGKHLALNQNLMPVNKPWPGNTRGAQVPSDQNAAAFTKSKSSHALGLHNPHQMPSSSFSHGPGFIFPFGSHQAMGATPGLSRPAASESNAALPSSATSLSFNNPNFTAKEALPSPYLAMLQSSGGAIPMTANNMAMPPLRGGRHFPTMPIFGSSLFNFSPSQQPQSSQTVTPSNPLSSSSFLNQPPQSSKPTTTDKSLRASATAPSQQPMHLSKKSSVTKPNTEYNLVHQFAKGLRPVQSMNSESIPRRPPQMMMMSEKNNEVEFVSPERWAFLFGSSTPESSAAAASSARASSAMIPSMQWHRQQLLQTKQMARDYTSNKRQVSENFPRSTAGVVTPQPLLSSNVTQQKASQSGSTLSTKETTEAASPSTSQKEPIQKTSPSCRKDVPSILGSGQLPKPKC